MSHVPALRHVKELVIVPVLAGRGLANLYDAWCLWKLMRELVEGRNTIGRSAAVLKNPYKATFVLGT